MWPDKEADIDYLNFGYLVDLIVDIATNRNLTPSTIGLYGDWGSGKSSLMKLAKVQIRELSKQRKENDDVVPKTLCIEFNGWLFEGYEDTKTSLCGTILDTLADEQRFGPQIAQKAKDLIKKIDFKKIMGKGVKYGLDYLLTGGIGALTDLTLSSILNQLKNQAGGLEAQDISDFIAKFKSDEKNRTEIKQFRKEFEQLLKDSKVENVVVFIDELDRCTPDTILDVFEAMRLFLFVEGMSFIIGADERLIQYAIKTKYKEVPGNNLDIGKEYLEKVIQYPITIPQLNHAEVIQYLACLLLEQSLTDKKEFNLFLDVIHKMEPDQELTMDILSHTSKELAEKCKADIALAKQIGSILAPSINGNPRQCKRFLNTLTMRLKLAKSRGVELDRNILAKLMLAEYFNPEFFKALTKSENRELFKDFEKGKDLTENNPFVNWQSKDWVRTWMKNGVSLDDEKMEKYVYFANVKNRYGQSNLDQLSPTARMCYDYLVDGTESNRSKALKLTENLAPGEKAIIAVELFSVIERASTMNVEVLRSYAEFCIKVGMIEEALKTMMELPETKYTPAAYGQLSTFISKLNQDEAKIFKEYLGKNKAVKKAIDRGEDLIKTLNNKK